MRWFGVAAVGFSALAVIAAVLAFSVSAWCAIPAVVFLVVGTLAAGVFQELEHRDRAGGMRR